MANTVWRKGDVLGGKLGGQDSARKNAGGDVNHEARM